MENSDTDKLQMESPGPMREWRPLAIAIAIASILAIAGSKFVSATLTKFAHQLLGIRRGIAFP